MPVLEVEAAKHQKTVMAPAVICASTSGHCEAVCQGRGELSARGTIFRAVPVLEVSRPRQVARLSVMGDGAPKQKEWYSRAWVVAAASAANFTYRIVADDEHGVDMTVHRATNTLDFQLKATSSPERQGDQLVYDLDVRTYNLLRSQSRSGYGVLALVVVADDTDKWLNVTDSQTTISHAAYYLPLMGLPDTNNAETIRLKIPVKNLLTADAIKSLMDAEAARWTA